jgi:hypothetical protein
MEQAKSGENYSAARSRLHENRGRLMAALLLLTAVGVPLSAPAAPHPPNGPHPAAMRNGPGGSHVYCIRGLLNVFSLGMDELCSELSRLGITASVYNHLAWAAIVDEAAAEYRAGRVRNIILVGHSLGATAVADITERLGELGVPVKLAIELDSTLGTTASGQVSQFVNYYISNGAGRPVARGANFKGTLQNIDVSKDPNIGHLNIDKNPGLHAQIIAQARRAVAR